MFTGTNLLALDKSGRLIIPSKYRTEIILISRNEEYKKQDSKKNSKGQMVITLSVDNVSLTLYPMNKWYELEKQLMEAPNLDPIARDLQRLILGSAENIEMDSNGRIRISQVLQDFAKIKSNLVLLGIGNKFELWNPQILAEQNQDSKIALKKSIAKGEVSDELQKNKYLAVCINQFY